MGWNKEVSGKCMLYLVHPGTVVAAQWRKAVGQEKATRGAIGVVMHKDT